MRGYTAKRLRRRASQIMKETVGIKLPSIQKIMKIMWKMTPRNERRSRTIQKFNIRPASM